MIDAILEYSKVSVTIQPYSKFQSHTKAMGYPSDQKDNRRNLGRTSAAADTLTTPEYVPGLKTNHDRNFTLDVKSYPLKVLVTEEICLGCLPKLFCDVRQENKTDRSTK